MRIKKQPNPRTHLIISLVKSLFRLAAGFVMMACGLNLAGALIIGAEILGILEELF